MADIRFETGLVDYDINGRATVRFNPTDSVFIERMFRAFDALDKQERAFYRQNRKFVDFRRAYTQAEETTLREWGV